MKMNSDTNDCKESTRLAMEVEGATPHINGRGDGWSLIPQKDNGCLNGKAAPAPNRSRQDAQDEEGDDDSHCGLGSWQPKWARRFESTHVFMVVFLLGWVLQGVFYTYFVSVITTIEKLFQIKSKTTGMLLAATEVGQICTALLLTYFAGRGHRPRWIACGMVLFAIGSLGCALPHFIFGSRLLESSHVMHGASTNMSVASLPAVCAATPSDYMLNNRSEVCEDNVKQEQEAHSHMTAIVLPIFIVCLFAVGVGQTAICTLGIPYIDDNVASRESPLYIAVTIGVRIVGPALGFILGSFCTRVYADLVAPAGLTPSDPRWVGAWWLGMVLVSSFLLLMGLAMFCFPRKLPGSKAVQEARAAAALQKPVEDPDPIDQKPPQLKDFPKTLKRQLSNDILMFRTASSVLHLLPVAGLYTFLPKYLESQFRLATHDANLISGIGGILVMGIGIMLSGAVILRYVPTARFVAGWIAFTAIAYATGMFILIFVGCPMDDMMGLSKLRPNDYGVSPSPANNIPLFFTKPSCDSQCHCEKDKFGVICGQDGRTYFSACHAGCRNVTFVNDTLKYFNCDCIAPLQNSSNPWDASSDKFLKANPKLGQAEGGYCKGNCTSFVLFICIFSFIMFTHATGEVGSILLIMRCTDPKDKAMAMGIIQFAIGLFGNVPCPIIFGAVVDSACLLWDSVCGKKGACFLYDSDVFRQFFLGTTGGIMALAFIVDIIVWCKASRIDINPEAKKREEDNLVECTPKTLLPQDLSTTPLTAPSNDTTV